MPKKLSMFISVILGAFCAVLLMVAGINALNNKTNLPFEISLDMEQEVQVQIDVARINEYNQRTESVTIFNNTNSGNRLGTEYNPDAVVKIDGKEITLNPWYSVFENLDSTDTLAFTVRSYTANPEEYSDSNPSAIKFTIDDVVDQDGNSIYHELTPTNSIAYVKAYDGSNVATGTLNLTNIVAYQDYTKIYIECSLEIVEYDYTLLSSDTYNIKEFTEAEYTKNALGSKFSNYTNLQYYNDANGGDTLESLGVNSYSSIAGVYGYYYYVEMGEYPQTFVGTQFNDALENAFGSYIDEGFFPQATRYVTDTSTNTTYKLEHQQTYYQSIFTGSAYQVAPVSWFTDNNGNTFARSLVYGYSSASYSSMKYWSTCDDYNLKLEDNGINVPTTATYNWFKVEPLNWIIYGSVTSGSSNSSQLSIVCSAIENQTKLKTIAQYSYDTSAFNRNVEGDYTASSGGNNWATSYARAVLNGETGTTYVGGSGYDNYANPYVFNSTNASSLTTFLNNNILTTANKTTERASSLIDMFFNSTEQQSIALTKNVTYFSQDTFNDLLKDEADNVPTSTPYYSTTYDKLYLLSGVDISPSYYNSNETNAYTEFSLTGTMASSFPTDYAMGHHCWVYLLPSLQTTTFNYIATYNYLRAGSNTYANNVYTIAYNGVLSMSNVVLYYDSLRPSLTFQF